MAVDAEVTSGPLYKVIALETGSILLKVKAERACK